MCRGSAAKRSGTQVRNLKLSVGYQGVQKDLEGGLCQPPCLHPGKCIRGEGDMAMLGEPPGAPEQGLGLGWRCRMRRN